MKRSGGGRITEKLNEVYKMRWDFVWVGIYVKSDSFNSFFFSVLNNSRRKVFHKRINGCLNEF